MVEREGNGARVNSDKIVNGGCWGISGRQAQKEWLVWGSDSVGRCASRAPGGGALLQD